MEKPLASLMDEIRGRLDLLESNLPESVDGIAVSSKSKLPWKVLVYRAALSWRMAELVRAASENFGKDNLAAAFVLTRAAVETSAALWYLCAKVAKSIDSSQVGNIDDYLMKMIAGIATGAPTDASTGEAATPRPIRVGAFCRRVDEDIEGFSHQYGILSEYAHPNWAGTVYLYAKHGKQNGVTDFGKNIRQPDGTRGIGISNLSVALAMFERSYNRVADLIPPFTTLCEDSVEKATGP
jgi:hypothetical protein